MARFRRHGLFMGNLPLLPLSLAHLARLSGFLSLPQPPSKCLDIPAIAVPEYTVTWEAITEALVAFQIEFFFKQTLGVEWGSVWFLL